ncbi:hypothetical protein ANCCAN_13553 [Ancylostoma caninum]|uniref:RING-type domain-containing protein n=1 Tax=Ancylostoma caninum TaxID=29170 RepID=A0A368GBW3_ANCCA|nr:hypothetical protein ANCCAN_13553 [Ancylostoma caninum]
MEIAEHCYDPYDKTGVFTICDANVTKYLSGNHNVLHVCFLKELRRVPIMGLASYDYKDIWSLNVTELGEYYAPFNFGKRRLPESLESGSIVPGDTVQVEFKFRGNQLYVRMGKNRNDWTRWLCATFDPTIRVSFVVESAKSNFVVIRDDLYLDYLLNGAPRTLRHCNCCTYDDKDRVVVAQCGHYMCIQCWDDWVKRKPDMPCWICCERIEHHVVARFRDSPCPIDRCRFGDTERDYVLVPCGCSVRCLNEEPGKPTRCPYEACNKIVKEKWALYEH